MKLKNHLASFLQGEKAKTRPKRTKSQVKAFWSSFCPKDLTLGLQREAYTEGESNECSDSDRRSRATTPGRALLEEVEQHFKPSLSFLPGEPEAGQRAEPEEPTGSATQPGLKVRVQEPFPFVHEDAGNGEKRSVVLAATRER